MPSPAIDPAREFYALYTLLCAECLDANVPAPTPDAFVELVESALASPGEEPGAADADAQ